MKIAVASGKGGTGKTTIVTSLVSIWPKKVIAVDMDVEEPNLHLFLKPKILKRYVSKLKVPVLDKHKCNYCGICYDFCQFSAIALTGKKILFFPEMCHGCGGCILLCPEKAISIKERILGEIIHGRIIDNIFLMGTLRIGEAISPPLMHDINDKLKLLNSKIDKDIIIDCPPGTSCPAVNAVSGSDLIILVTEPTIFGLHDLRLAYEAFSPLGIPMTVIVNRFSLGEDKILNFCENNKLPIIAKIPYDRQIEYYYSNSKPIVEASNEIKQIFEEVYKKIYNLLKH